MSQSQHGTSDIQNQILIWLISNRKNATPLPLTQFGRVKDYRTLISCLKPSHTHDPPNGNILQTNINTFCTVRPALTTGSSSSLQTSTKVIKRCRIFASSNPSKLSSGKTEDFPSRILAYDSLGLFRHFALVKQTCRFTESPLYTFHAEQTISVIHVWPVQRVSVTTTQGQLNHI